MKALLQTATLTIPLAILISSSGCATPPSGASQPLHQHQIVKPATWTRLPTAEQLAAVYPREAMASRISGVATLHCTITVDGGVRDCTVRDETPRARGFGAAALKLTPLFHFKPKTVDGRPVESDLIVPIRFGGS